jgi:3-methyladenine DNA glycosylase Mpg|tara:strand:- start:259 stop:459 length:201 start_codon:yes stop_codon:yes gene_type:complete
MKVGDLVKYKNLHGHVIHGKFVSKSWTGIIVEVGAYTGNKDLVVMWHHGTTATESRESLEVINESR